MGYKEVAEMEHVGDATDIAKKVGEALANKVKIETTLFESTVNPFDKGEPSKASNFFGWLIRPKATVYNNLGKEEYSAAPYGDPKENAGLVKAGGLTLLLASLAGVFGLGRLSKK